MAAIRIKFNPGTASEFEGGVLISDVRIDSDGYLQFFTAEDPRGVKYIHSFRRKHLSQFELAVAIFGAGTSMRSAKGLLEDFAKILGREKSRGKAGAAGVAIGSAVLLHEFLKTRPFDVEGYYDSDGQLWLPRLIHSKSSSDYDPNFLPKR